MEAFIFFLYILIHSVPLSLALWVNPPPSFLKQGQQNWISSVSQYLTSVPTRSTVHSWAQLQINEYTWPLSDCLVCVLLVEICDSLWIRDVSLIWGVWPGCRASLCVCLMNDAGETLICLSVLRVEWRREDAYRSPEAFKTSENTGGGLNEYHSGYVSIRKIDCCWLLLSFLSRKNVLLCDLTIRMCFSLPRIK